MAENIDVYSEMDKVLNDEKNNVSVPDEKKEALLKQLQELADQGNDFDPDRLEGIITLASGNTSDIAKSVLLRATEQKNKLNVANEGADMEAPIGKDMSLLDKDVEIINQPSYNIRKEYERLSAKEDLTDEEKSVKQNIEKNVEAYLSSVGDINTDNVVAIMDYLAVSEMSGLDEVKERNETLSQKANDVVTEYDKENGLEALDGKDSQFISDNLQKWKNLASEMSQEELTSSSPYSDILNSLSDEEKGRMQEFMMVNTVHSLKVHSPSEFGSDASKKLSETLENTSSEYAVLINEEYLKQEAMADFCEQNKISSEQMNEILAKEEKGEKLSASEQKLKADYMAQLQTRLEKAPSFKGPYKNKEFLRSAITTVNAVTVSRLRDLDCRMAQKVNAPSASQEVTKENNSFAKNHPKLAMAVNMVKGIGISMAFGAVGGPVGLTVYSAINTASAISKSYKRFEENKGGGLKDYLKFLTSREGRVEALSLAGSVVATCISGYFTLGPGIENFVEHGVSGLKSLDLGIVGNFTGNTGVVADAAAQTATQSMASAAEATAPTVLGSIKDGFTSIMSSPRRAISMASSLSVGVTKGLVAANNLRYARKQLSNLLAQSGAEIDKKALRSLEGLSEKDFYAKLSTIAPNLTEQQTKEAFKHVTLANQSNPKSEFLAATIGAGIGLGISATMDYINDVQADTDAVNTQTPVIDNENIAPHTGDVIWQNEDMADQRFESFGIDAKGANEMLRDMGIIKEGDNHFYRQSELNNLVNGSDLTGEQKLAIQEWANDRDARVDAMLKWQAEHPAPVAPKPDLSVNKDPIFDEPISTNPGDLPKEIPGTMYSVYGKTDGQSFQGVVLGNDPVDAGLKARDMFDEDGFLDKKSSITVRGDGVITEIDQKVKGDYVRTDVTTRDLDGDKLASQRIKSFDNGVMESKFKGDLDDDGKRDTVTRVTGADGASVSYTKFGNGERAVSYTDAEGRTTEVTSQEMEENGLKHVNSQLKKAYKEIAEDIRENNTNAQMGGDAVSTAESTTQTVEGTTPTVDNTSVTQSDESTSLSSSIAMSRVSSAQQRLALHQEEYNNLQSSTPNGEVTRTASTNDTSRDGLSNLFKRNRDGR